MMLQVLLSVLLAIAAIFYAIWLLVVLHSSEEDGECEFGYRDDGVSGDSSRNWGGDAQRGDGCGGTYSIESEANHEELS